MLAALAVLGAVSLILQRHPIHSALSLIVVMVALAGLYLLLGAEFVAAVQIIVYGGAIMVLFVFVIMLLNAGVEERTNVSKLAGVAGIPLAVALAWIPGRGHCAFDRERASGVRRPARPRRYQGDFDHALPGICVSVRADFVPDSRRDPGRDRAGAAGEKLKMVPTNYYLILSAILFGLGVVAFVFQAQHHHDFHVHRADAQRRQSGVCGVQPGAGTNWTARFSCLFVIVVAAAEAAVGLGIIILIARNRQSLNVERVDLLKL